MLKQVMKEVSKERLRVKLDHILSLEKVREAHRMFQFKSNTSTATTTSIPNATTTTTNMGLAVMIGKMIIKI